MASGTIKNLPFTRLDLLWTNPSSTSSFAAQDVSVNLDGYDLVAIKVRFTTTETSVALTLMFFPIRDGQDCYIFIVNNSSNYTGGRTFTYSDANKTIHFTKGQYNANTTDNAHIIPLEIYGVKL